MEFDKSVTRREFLRAGVKFAGTALLVSSVGSFLSACGPILGNSSANVNLVFLIWDPTQQSVIDEQIKQFKNKYPQSKVTLNILSYTDYWTKLPIEIAGGTGPDIFVMTRPQFEVYCKANRAADLQDAVSQSSALQSNLAAMSSTFVNTYKYKGKQRAIPFGVDSTAVVFNKTMFQNAGLKLPTDVETSWTWNDLRDYAVKLTKRTGNNTDQYGFVVSTGGHGGWWEFLWSNGGELFNADGTQCRIASPQGIQAIQFLADLMLKDRVSPTPTFQLSETADKQFASGKIAMMITGDWSMPTYQKIKDFEWDVVELPLSPNTNKRVCSSNVMGYIVNPNTKHMNETIQLLEQLTTQNAQELYSKSGVFIPARTDAQSAFFSSNLPPNNRKAFQRALAYAHPMAFTEWISYPEIIKITTDAMQKILSGTVSVQAGWTQAQDQINSTIKQNMSKG